MGGSLLDLCQRGGHCDHCEHCNQCGHNGEWQGERTDVTDHLQVEDWGEKTVVETKTAAGGTTAGTTHADGQGGGRGG